MYPTIGWEILEWFKRQRLTHIQVTPTGLYGWRGYGECPDPTAVDAGGPNDRRRGIVDAVR